MMLGAVPAAADALAGILAKVRAALHRDAVRDTDSSLPALADEFKRQPFGRHSEDLQMLLHQMRSEPIGGKPFLFMSEPQREWVLGRYTDDPPYRPILDWSVTFTDLEAAEWHVFRMRWRKLFGEDLR
jgi:branched-chain amino acid transport system permease protein